MAKSEEKTVDYGGDICSYFVSCLFGGAFSSDYMPLSLCNSAFSLFSELSVQYQATATENIALGNNGAACDQPLTFSE